jgi:hypothetical protein
MRLNGAFVGQDVVESPQLPNQTKHSDCGSKVVGVSDFVDDFGRQLNDAR